MNNDQSEINLAETSGISPPASANASPKTDTNTVSAVANDNQQAQTQALFASSQQDEAARKKEKRTWGLRLFDILVYPIFNNTSVFIASVLLTYLSQYGGTKRPDGTFRHGWIGQQLSKRNAPCIEWLHKRLGMNRETTAKGTMMVVWSFVDGSIFAVAVKWLEDRREKIAEMIDDALGTRPADNSVYEAEPKQTWKSVLAGRFLTAGIVAPTAMILERNGYHAKFHEWGESFGQWLSKKTSMNHVGEWETGKIAHISIFEAIYTSICTAGLYFSSRIIARVMGEHAEKKHEAALVRTEQFLPPTNDNIHHINDNKKVETASHPRTVNGDKTPNATIARASTQGRIHTIPQHEQAAT